MPILTNEMMRAIIMDHNNNPRNKKVPEENKGYISVHRHSDNCVDDIEVYIKEENGIITDCLWYGTACAISAASTDIMCDMARGKNKEEAMKVISNFMAMLHEEHYDEEVLDEANAFANTYKQASRIRCAMIGWDGLKELIEDGKDHK